MWRHLCAALPATGLCADFVGCSHQWCRDPLSEEVALWDSPSSCCGICKGLQASEHGVVAAACWKGPAHRRSGLQAALDQLHGAGQQAYGHARARARKEVVAYGELRACTDSCHAHLLL